MIRDIIHLPMFADICQGKGRTISFYLGNGELFMSITAETEKECDEWFEEIQDTINAGIKHVTLERGENGKIILIT